VLLLLVSAAQAIFQLLKSVCFGCECGFCLMDVVYLVFQMCYTLCSELSWLCMADFFKKRDVLCLQLTVVLWHF
jgi:hypothetical protein